MRTYYIVTGSKAFFESKRKSIDCFKNAQSFLELIKLMDNCRQNGKDFKTVLESENLTINSIVVKNDDYHAIVDTAHDRLGALIEELSTTDANILVHNPPRVLKEYLIDLKERSVIELNEDQEQYSMLKDKKRFNGIMNDISTRIIGQDNAIREISKSLWYLTNSERRKPYVIMLFGKSSLGKTELVREVAKSFFDDKYLEKHLSMFKNNNYADYFFGDSPNRKSIGFDLLERNSNLIFFDEIDKCPEHFYSAFYTLFDNEEFKDSTYDVNISGTIIFLTSNYNSLDEIKNTLGLPIFYRIDKFIKFEDFPTKVIDKITRKEIAMRIRELNNQISEEELYTAVSRIINSTGENARTIQQKIQKTIEELLFEHVGL